MIKSQKQHLRSYLLHCGHGLLGWYLLANLPVFQIPLFIFYVNGLVICFISTLGLAAVGYAVQLVFEWCLDQ